VSLEEWLKEKEFGCDCGCTEITSVAIPIIRELKGALEFYKDDKGEHWAACRPEDTGSTCCHMIAENSGGETATKALNKCEEIIKE